MKIVEPVGGESNIQGSVIFLHGLGDVADSWVDCAPVFQQTVPGTRWIFPTAPLRKMTYAGGLEQTSWYDIISIENRESELFYYYIFLLGYS